MFRKQFIYKTFIKESDIPKGKIKELLQETSRLKLKISG